MINLVLDIAVSSLLIVFIVISFRYRAKNEELEDQVKYLNRVIDERDGFISESYKVASKRRHEDIELLNEKDKTIRQLRSIIAADEMLKKYKRENDDMVNLEREL
jgi:hypothetical protein